MEFKPGMKVRHKRKKIIATIIAKAKDDRPAWSVENNRPAWNVEFGSGVIGVWFQDNIETMPSNNVDAIIFLKKDKSF